MALEFTDPKDLTLSREERRESPHKPGLAYEVYSEVVDERGNPRLSAARHFFLPLIQEDLSLLTEVYSFWREFAEYMLLKGENRWNEKKLFLAVKCSKRGNDVFARRLKRRLGFLKTVRDVKFFRPEDFGPDREVRTNLLWVTWTYDSKRCSLDQAWKSCMKEWNLAITNLRNKYGKIDVLRFPQPFPDSSGEAYGYPHFHTVLLFKEASFRVFPNLEEDREGKMGLVYRIQERSHFKSQAKWHSFVDIKALSSARAAANYCLKYAERVAYGSSAKAVLNGAVLWLYKKQTYSMSSGFRSKFLEFIHGLHDSKRREAQKTLSGDVLEDWIWSFHGIRSAFNVGVDGVPWVVSLEAEKFHRLVDPGG